jgi:hypothetical protein
MSGHGASMDFLTLRAQRRHVARPEFSAKRTALEGRADLVGAQDQQPVPGPARKCLLQSDAALDLQHQRRVRLQRPHQRQHAMRRQNGRQHHHLGCLLHPTHPARVSRTRSAVSPQILILSKKLPIRQPLRQHPDVE